MAVFLVACGVWACARLRSVYIALLSISLFSLPLRLRFHKRLPGTSPDEDAFQIPRLDNGQFERPERFRTGLGLPRARGECRTADPSFFRVRLNLPQVPGLFALRSN